MSENEKAERHLLKSDPVLAEVIKKVGALEERKSQNYFLDLIESIISQQLSIKAAGTIWKRFQNLFRGDITAEKVLKTDDQKIRDCGISWAKISYIKDLAKHTKESTLMFEKFDEMGDEEIAVELVRVKGIGRWTAEMFLMFAMGRPDIFSYGDLGIRKGVMRLYGMKSEPTVKQAEKISEKWKPYRTYGCRYVWKSLEIS